MTRKSLGLTLMAGMLLLATPAFGQKPIKKPEKPIKTTTTAAPSRPATPKPPKVNVQPSDSPVSELDKLRRDAEQGDAEAQYALGFRYYNGDGVTQSYSEAVKWFTKAAAQGEDMAQFVLGGCYVGGYGVAQDVEEGVKWWRKAAVQGNADAQYWLGLSYANGTGVPESSTEAARWYAKAAEQGQADAQLSLGVCYDCGYGVTQDYTEAVKWYRKAADQGLADAQFSLGMCYANGIGVPQSEAEAVKWWRKAAEQGNADAQYGLGLCYANGDGVSQNSTEAVKWYKMAAEQGHTLAEMGLGLCYFAGEGVTQDFEEGVKWYHKAAEQGDADAQNGMGGLYEQGLFGVSQSTQLALYWYRQAAEQGNEEAIEALQRLGYYNGSSSTGTESGHEWVDLGLSVKWATCNVGASSPSEYGSYYAWGETQPKASYTESNSSRYNMSMPDIAGFASYDAAYNNWGSSWRLPTKAEINELISKCHWVWTTKDGVSGYAVIGQNGNSIFLPAAGYRSGTELNKVGEFGDYWTSTPYEGDSQNAYYLYFNIESYYKDWHDPRITGQPIRPVYGKTVASITYNAQTSQKSKTAYSNSGTTAKKSSSTKSSKKSKKSKQKTGPHKRKGVVAAKVILSTVFFPYGLLSLMMDSYSY
ncbi:MAG: hypothetical protein LUI09_07790 [Prevotellaceae bacterium]|nr:hypothetical protein [Prevotellaceae bacterium]